MPESFERGAMTEATYLILLALTEPMHGYGVMQAVSDMTGGRVNLGAGTLYGALNLLLDKQWIRGAAEVGGKGRRKAYALTKGGRAALEEELRRLEELIGLGKRHLGGALA